MELPSLQREQILWEAVADVQKAYLLGYVLRRYPILCIFVSMFAGQFCSEEECTSLFAAELIDRETFCYSMGYYGRPLQEKTWETFCGLIDAKHVNMYSVSLFTPPLILRCALNGDTATKPLLENYWHNGWLCSQTEDWILASCRVGIAEVFFSDYFLKIAYADKIRCLCVAAQHGYNDLFSKLLQTTLSAHSTVYDIPVCLIRKCIRYDNETCIQQILPYRDRGGLHDSILPSYFDCCLWKAYAKKYADPQTVIRAAEKLSVSPHYDFAAIGAARAGHVQAMLYFLSLDSSKAPACFYHAARGGHFEVMKLLQERYSIPRSMLPHAMLLYSHDHEWVCEWLMDCAGGASEFSSLLSVVDTVDLQQFTRRMGQKPFSLAFLVRADIVPVLPLPYLDRLNKENLLQQKYIHRTF